MKTLIAALSVSLLSNVALADGFAPWTARTVVPDTTAASSAPSAPAGFAPWRDLTPQAGASDAATDLGLHTGSAFRPWHVAS